MTRIVHMSLEYRRATLGGLGVVVNELVEAQNRIFIAQKDLYKAEAVTPYYREIFDSLDNYCLVAEVSHLFDHTYVKSKIYRFVDTINPHYVVVPSSKYMYIFDVPDVSKIYADILESSLLDRVKYFCAAASAFVNLRYNLSNIYPDVLVTHGWNQALSLKILKERYTETEFKSIYVMHIDNADHGTSATSKLSGIGVSWSSKYCNLKALGLTLADRIVAVSPSFLEQCKTYVSEDIAAVAVARIIRMRKDCAVGILNGINYAKYCPLGKQIKIVTNIAQTKESLRYNLYERLGKAYPDWRCDPKLPLILYIGRFSREKGVNTFSYVINAVKGRAVFIALGRGMTKRVQRTMDRHHAKTDGVFISSDPFIQQEYKELLRASADFTFVPSYTEACGLVPMEGYANGAACICSAALQDSLLPNKSFVFNLAPPSFDKESLKNTLSNALNTWDKMNTDDRNMYQRQVMFSARKFDWADEEGSASQYNSIIEELVPARPALLSL